jgi:hypothetical protein
VSHSLVKIRDSDPAIWVFAVLDKCHYSLNLYAGGQSLVTVWWNVPNFWFASVVGGVRKAGCESLLLATLCVSVCPHRATRLAPNGFSLNSIFEYSVKICLHIQVLINFGHICGTVWPYWFIIIETFCVRCEQKSHKTLTI